MTLKRTRATALRALMEQLTISVDDLALLLECDRKLAYDEVKAGKYDHIKVGRLFRVTTAGVRRRLGVASEKSAA
jgi:hypothetical protein